MSEIVIYTKVNCPFSREAKNLCNILYIPYKEHSLDGNHPHYDKIKQNLFNHYNHYSFPIIIIGGSVLGGYSELRNAYKSKKLHRLCSKVGISIAK